MPFGFHGLDLVVILVIALLIFGPKRLPEMGSAIGKSISSFKKGMSEITAPKEEKPEAYEPLEHEVVTHHYSVPTPEVVSEIPHSETNSAETSIN